MKNWSGNINWHPDEILMPDKLEDIIALVKRAIDSNRKIRIMGSAHSFMPLVSTEDIQLNLSRYKGLLRIDEEKQIAYIKAGTTLADLSTLLDEKGYALENMGDISSQSLAGAISTGTHGTGIKMGNISTQLESVQFVNGNGDLVYCSREDKEDLFKAAALSLGSLGIITELGIRIVPAFNLSLQLRKQRIIDVIRDYKSIIKENRGFEYYWIPNTDYVMGKYWNKSEAAAEGSTLGTYFQEMVLENYAFGALCRLSSLFPSSSLSINKLCARLLEDKFSVQKSFQSLTSERLVKFNEMEYALPLDQFSAAMKAVRYWIGEHNKEIVFPMDCSFVQGDDLYLSPAFGRNTVYIAAHVYHRKSAPWYFKGLEGIFRSFGGRPHWGKIHGLDSDTFSEIYPMYNYFSNIRQAQDPQRLFINNHLASIFP